MYWQVLVSTGYVSVFSVQGACAKGQLGVELLVDCDCSVKDTFWNYWPKKSELWWASYSIADGVGDIQSKVWKVLYLPKPCSRVWIVPVYSLLGRLPLVPAGDTGTIQHSMQCRMDTCYPANECDNVVTSWLSLGLEAHCSTSILGSWSFPLTILQTENPNPNSLLPYQQ